MFPGSSARSWHYHLPDALMGVPFKNEMGCPIGYAHALYSNDFK